MATTVDEKEAANEAPSAAATAVKTGNPWLPVIAVVVLVPGISFALTQWVLIPRLKAAMTAGQQAQEAAPAGQKHAAPKDSKTDGKPAFSYDFTGIVVNLSGSMGTRYLKVSFTVFSSNPDLQKIVSENKPQLLDVALNVLSSRTLAELEAAGARNTVRNDLVTNLNQALNNDVVSQVYFSEFVVQ